MAPDVKQGAGDGGAFHYCCDHSVTPIARGRIVTPRLHPLLGRELAWATDLDVPDRVGLGLTSTVLHCDRPKWRVTVSGALRWWPHWARENKIPQGIRDDLETFGLPAHWWVSETPLHVVSVQLTAKAA